MRLFRGSLPTKKAAATSAALLFFAFAGLSTAQMIVEDVTIGTDVCVEGYVMDVFCIERGTLLDRPSVVTLEEPNLHSLHCLVDVARCRNSGYEILMDKADGETLHARAWRLDEAGNDAVVDLARQTGEDGFCTTCSGPAGSQTEGFRATINGTVTDLGDSNTPATIRVTAVQDSSVGCGNIMFMPPNMVTESGGKENEILLHGSLMIIGWGLLLPSGAVFARLFKHRPDGLWYKIHRALQVVGLIVSLVGWIVALKNFDVFADKDGKAYYHGVLGCMVMSLGLLQPLNAAVRPHLPEEGEEKTSRRVAWEFIHKGAGYVALILAVVTIGIGTTLVPQESDQEKFQIAYGAGVGGFLLLLIGLLVVDKKRNPPAKEISDDGFEQKHQV